MTNVGFITVAVIAFVLILWILDEHVARHPTLRVRNEPLDEDDLVSAVVMEWMHMDAPAFETVEWLEGELDHVLGLESRPTGDGPSRAQVQIVVGKLYDTNLYRSGPGQLHTTDALDWARVDEPMFPAPDWDDIEE